MLLSSPVRATTVLLSSSLIHPSVYEFPTQQHILIEASRPLQSVSDIQRQVPWLLGAAP